MLVNQQDRLGTVILIFIVGIDILHFDSLTARFICHDGIALRFQFFRSFMFLNCGAFRNIELLVLVPARAVKIVAFDFFVQFIAIRSRPAGSADINSAGVAVFDELNAAIAAVCYTVIRRIADLFGLRCYHIVVSRIKFLLRQNDIIAVFFGKLRIRHINIERRLNIFGNTQAGFIAASGIELDLLYRVDTVGIGF